MDVIGDIENRYCPMNIAHEGENIFSGYFNGYMDEVNIRFFFF